MKYLLNRKVRHVILAVYFTVINILFCLPGAVFPKDDWLDKIWFDKWVHVGFFALLIILLCWAFDLSRRKDFLIITGAAALYGLLIEIIQDQFVANRSFDAGDWAADIAGTCFGLFLWRYIKK